MAAYSCHNCHDAFSSLSDVVLHTRARHRKQDTPLRCYLKGCQEEVEIAELTKHIRQQHPEQCAIVCRLCLQKFLFQFDYRNHARRIHGENLRFRQIKCPTCKENIPDYTADHHRLVECYSDSQRNATRARAKARPSDLLGQTFDSLDDFVTESIQVSKDYTDKCRQAISDVTAFIKSEDAPISITSVKEGGALGKGTMVKDKTDVCLITYTSDFKNMDDHISKGDSVAGQLKAALENSNDLRDKISNLKESADTVTFDLGVADDDCKLKIELRPSYKLLHENARRDEKRRLYRKMLNIKDQDREIYHSALMSSQVEFISQRQAQVKKLIQLVKYWRNESFDDRRVSRLGRKLPSAYLLELVVIRAWEEAGNPEEFQLALGFRAVLEKLVENRAMFVVWYDNYDKSVARDSMRKFKMRRPIVLDPVDPTFNVAAECTAWREVESVAQDTLKKYLFKSWV